MSLSDDVPRGEVAAALAQRVRERDALLARATRALLDDPRVVAAWLGGSLGRGEADAWSDLDLGVVVADASFAAFLAGPGGFDDLLGRCGRVILRLPETPLHGVPAGRVRTVVFAGALPVDWAFLPASAAARPAATRLLCDRVGVPVADRPRPPRQSPETGERWLAAFWATALTAARWAGRGDTARAAQQVTVLTYAAVDLWHLARRPDHPRPDLGRDLRSLEPELAAGLPRLGRHLSPASVLAVLGALGELVAALRPELAALGIAWPDEAAADARRLIELARESAV